MQHVKYISCPNTPSWYATQVPDNKAAHMTASKAFRKLVRNCVPNHESITFNGLSPAGSKVNKAHYTYFILTSAAQTALATAAQEWLSESAAQQAQGPGRSA